MLALSIRQPFAELILRGIKRIEYRSRPTKIVGERFWIYAGRKWAEEKWAVGGGQREKDEGGRRKDEIWSNDLDGRTPPEWMIELAQQIKLIEPGTLLPRGVIVGSAVIEKVTVDSRQSAVGSKSGSSLPTADCGLPTLYHWHLTDIKRLANPRKPKGHPQPVWFRPF